MIEDNAIKEAKQYTTSYRYFTTTLIRLEISDRCLSSIEGESDFYFMRTAEFEYCDKWGHRQTHDLHKS